MDFQTFQFAVHQNDVGFFAAYIVAMIAGTLLHEAGHWIAAWTVGIRNGRLVFDVLRTSRLPLPRFGVDIAARDLLSISRLKRRYIFAAGSVVDAFVGLGTWLLLPHTTIDQSIIIAIFIVATLRVALIPLNLVPIGKLKNDGWRMMNPDAVD